MTQDLVIPRSLEVLDLNSTTDPDFAFAVWWRRWSLRLRTCGWNRNRRNHTHHSNCDAFDWTVTASTRTRYRGCVSRSSSSDRQNHAEEVIVGIGRLNEAAIFAGFSLDVRFAPPARLAPRMQRAEVLHESFVRRFTGFDGA